jgi:hypothetical protein
MINRLVAPLGRPENFVTMHNKIPSNPSQVDKKHLLRQVSMFEYDQALNLFLPGYGGLYIQLRPSGPVHTIASIGPGCQRC